MQTSIEPFYHILPTRKVKMKEKNKYLKNNSLYVHVILDKSGSMNLIKQKTINAFNEYVESLAPDTIVSLSLFSGLYQKPTVETVISEERADKVAPLTEKTYIPSGNTPLYDAIGEVLMMMDDRKENTVLVILTDGEENASKEFDSRSIKRLLENKKEKGWLITYLGANQDAFREAGKLGISLGTTMAYDVNAIGKTMKSAARSTVAYSNALAMGQSIGAATQDAMFTDEERKEVI
jgi:hypothetical protein